MSAFHTDQRLVLVDAGTADTAGQPWRGGRGCFITYTGTLPSGGIGLQMSPDNGTTWVAVSADNDDGDVARTTHGTSIFTLPACLIRASAGWTSGNALAVSV